MLDKLSSLREKEGRLIKELETTQAEIASYETALSEFVKPTARTAPHNQTYSHPTQAVAGVHTRNTKPTTMAPTATIQPANVTAAEQYSNQTSTAATVPQTKLRPSSQPTTPSNVPGMISILANRAPYHTPDIQITGIHEYGQVIVHKHYLSGDGIHKGVATPNGYVVTTHTSGANSTYRLMEVTALRITCTITKPLPADTKTRKELIGEWLAANDYLKGTDPSKTQFHTEYDAWNKEYSPFVSVDGKGTTLYIYIGCESLTSAKPMPTLIA